MAMSSVSVVTNALRLRGFRRPASAEEILHPPLRRARRRVRLPGRHRRRRAGRRGGRARLRPAGARRHDRHAQTRTPFHEHPDHEPSCEHHPRAAAATRPPARPRPRAPASSWPRPPRSSPASRPRLTYRLTDAATGAPVTDVVDSHERPMHLIAVSRDLQAFQHVHPEPTGAAGEYRVEMTLPRRRAPTSSSTSSRARAAQHVVAARRARRSARRAAGPPGSAEDLAPKTSAPTRVALAGADAIRAGQEATLTFRLDDARPASRSATSSRTWAPRPTASSSARTRRASPTPTASRSGAAPANPAAHAGGTAPPTISRATTSTARLPPARRRPPASARRSPSITRSMPPDCTSSGDSSRQLTARSSPPTSWCGSPSSAPAPHHRSRF